MTYLLIYLGGPKDGQEVYSCRPYDAVREADGSVYSAEADASLEWVSDDVRRRTLRFRGYQSAEEFAEENGGKH